MPEAIAKNTTAIAKVETKLENITEQSEIFLNQLQNQQAQLEREQEAARAEGLKASFLMYAHGLTFDDLRAPPPRDAIYHTVERFITRVLGAPLSDFLINSIQVIGLQKAEQTGMESEQVGLLVITGRQGAWHAMVNRYGLFQRLQEWHQGGRQDGEPKYSIKENLTPKGRMIENRIRNVMAEVKAKKARGEIDEDVEPRGAAGIIIGGTFYSRTHILNGDLDHLCPPPPPQDDASMDTRESNPRDPRTPRPPPAGGRGGRGGGNRGGGRGGRGRGKYRGGRGGGGGSGGGGKEGSYYYDKWGKKIFGYLPRSPPTFPFPTSHRHQYNYRHVPLPPRQRQP